MIELKGASIVVDAGQPSYVQHAVRELKEYLRELTGSRLGVSTSPSTGADTIVVVGPESLRRLLSKLPTERPGTEGYALKSWNDDGRDIIGIGAADPKGTKFGIYALMKMIRTRGKTAYLDGPIDVTSKPAFALRGMHLNGWSINYPYSFRRWPERDWERYIDMLSMEGVNLLYIWPFMEIIPAPVSKEDEEYLREFKRTVEYAQREHGMEVWMMQSPNRIALDNCGVIDPRNRPYWRMDHQTDPNPGDPEGLRKILESREALYKIVDNVDGVCTIDCDPGGTPGAPVSDWAKIFNGCRALLDKHNQHGSTCKQIAWLHLGWGRTTPLRLDYPMHDIIKGLERDCKGPMMYIAGWPALTQMCKDAGVIDRTVAFPYSTIEGEPTYPTTRPDLQDVKGILDVICNFPDAAGAMGNVQCPLLQFPRVHYFLSSIWNHGYRNLPQRTSHEETGELLYPDHAQFIADCYDGLKDQEPGRISALASRLGKLIDQNKLGRPGIIGRKLFPNKSIVAESLVMQLRLHAATKSLYVAMASATSIQDIRKPLIDAFNAYMTWDKAHGWHDLWGTAWPQNANPIFAWPGLPDLVRSTLERAGGKASFDTMLRAVAQELAAEHDKDNVNKFCIEPMMKMAQEMK